MRWTLTLEERFWQKVNRTSGCWLWTGATDSHGYGQIWGGKDRGRKIPAHRLAWEISTGPIASGMFVDHLCHQPLCVKTQHLRLATTKQNNENRRGAQVNSTSQVRGVSFHKGAGKWRARCKHNGVEHHGGLFETLHEAEAAAIALRNELFTHNSIDRRAA